MPCPERYRESLDLFETEPEITESIFDGYEKITTKTPKKTKAAFFKRALDIMNEKLPPEKTSEILQWNACCKTGARLKASKEFARINAGLKLEDKLAKIRKAQYMNMGSPEAEQDGIIKLNAVSYVYEGRYECGCSNFSRIKRDYSVSKNYCYCCAGHFKFHYEIMLGIKLKVREIISSPLDSNGENPCVISFEIINEE